MSDMQKAVEAAARAMCNSQSCKSAFHADGKVIVDRWTFIGGAESETGRWRMDNAKEALAAARPHLASAQPQPSKSDEERARLFFDWPDSIDRLASAFAAKGAEERAAALDECEEIARRELSGQWPEWDMRVRRIADAIAALKRSPVAEDSGE